MSEVEKLLGCIVNEFLESRQLQHLAIPVKNGLVNLTRQEKEVISDKLLKLISRMREDQLDFVPRKTPTGKFEQSQESADGEKKKLDGRRTSHLIMRLLQLKASGQVSEDKTFYKILLALKAINGSFENNDLINRRINASRFNIPM